MSKRQIWYLVIALLVLVLLARYAHANLLGGTGKLMGPTSRNNGNVPASNEIITEAGVPITTEAGDVLVLEP